MERISYSLQNEALPADIAHVASAPQNTPDIHSYHQAIPQYVERSLKSWLKKKPIPFSAQVSLPRYSLSQATNGIDEPARGWLLVDMARCIATVAKVATGRRLKISFGPVLGNQCRKFHLDHVRYRLVRTYVGPGTQWVTPSNVREDGPMLAGESPEQANRRIIKNLNDVHHAGPEQVLLMRGARHENSPATLHRSPPIEGTGARRVVLIVSTVHESSVASPPPQLQARLANPKPRT